MKTSSETVKTTVEAWERAYNRHDLSKIKDLYEENIAFAKVGLIETEGRQSAHEVAKFDSKVETQSSLNIERIEGDTAYCDMREKSVWLRAAGIEEAHYSGAFVVQDGRIKSLRFEPKPETKQATEKAMASFTKWATKEKPEHLGEIMPEGKSLYNAENAEKWIHLMQEWRETTQTK